MKRQTYQPERRLSAWREVKQPKRYERSSADVRSIATLLHAAAAAASKIHQLLELSRKDRLYPAYAPAQKFRSQRALLETLLTGRTAHHMRDRAELDIHRLVGRWAGRSTKAYP